MFGNSQLGGVNIGFPDICKTPPMIPFPYPNFSFGPTGVPFSPKIFWMLTPAHFLLTKPLISVGDTPGILLGLISQTVMAPTQPVIGAFTLLLHGMPATRMTTINVQNFINSPGMTLVPAQIKILILKP